MHNTHTRSRIGVISTAQEQQLQGALGALGAFHIICAVVAARSAWAKGLPVLPSAAKVLLHLLGP